MAEGDYSDVAHIVKVIKEAKSNPAHFAFALGATADASMLGVHRTQKGDHILAALKRETGGSKGAWGTVEINGHEAVFTCEHGLTGLEKLLVAWFHHHKITSFKPIVSP